MRERAERDNALQCRLVERDGLKLISGYGAVFYDQRDQGTEFTFDIWGDTITERIMPTAFDEALKRADDVVGLVNHNRDRLLGRTTSGTMKLSVDERGLAYEIEAPDTTAGRDALAEIERGDMRGSSFAFYVDDQRWIKDGEREVREINSVTLIDTGPVLHPAYPSTTAAVRDELQAAYGQHLRSQGRGEKGALTLQELQERLAELARENTARYDDVQSRLCRLADRLRACEVS